MIRYTTRKKTSYVVESRSLNILQLISAQATCSNDPRTEILPSETTNTSIHNHKANNGNEDHNQGYAHSSFPFIAHPLMSGSTTSYEMRCLPQQLINGVQIAICFTTSRQHERVEAVDAIPSLQSFWFEINNHFHPLVGVTASTADEDMKGQVPLSVEHSNHA